MILLDQPSIPDAYDIVWIPRFDFRVNYHDKYPLFEITNHLLMTKRIMVVRLYTEKLAQLKYLVSHDVVDNSPAYNRGDNDRQNFVRSIDKVVFYTDNVNPEKSGLRLSEQKIREKLIKTVNALLTK